MLEILGDLALGVSIFITAFIPLLLILAGISLITYTHIKRICNFIICRARHK